jgi:hypothetical protein
MKVGAFIRGAPAEEQKMQRRAIKEMLKGQGADVTWFREADGRQRRDEQDRVELQRKQRHTRDRVLLKAIPA